MQNVDACATSESFDLDVLVVTKILKTKAFNSNGDERNFKSTLFF